MVVGIVVVDWVVVVLVAVVVVDAVVEDVAEKQMIVVFTLTPIKNARLNCLFKYWKNCFCLMQ